METVQNQIIPGISQAQQMQCPPGMLMPQQACYPPTVSVNVYANPYNYPAAPIYNYPTNNIYTPQAVPAAVIQSAPVPPPPSVIDTQANKPTLSPQPAEVKNTEAPIPQLESVSPQTASAIQAINAGLNSEKTDDQMKAMEQMGSIFNDPKQVQALLTEQTFTGLANILAKDSSKLTPEEKEKADKAVIIATIATSALQKTLKEIFNADAAKIQGPLASFIVLPNMTQLINNLKSHPNPDVRTSSIVALMHTANPKENQEEKNELTTILTLAKKDPDANVSESADSALNALAQVN